MYAVIMLDYAGLTEYNLSRLRKAGLITMRRSAVPQKRVKILVLYGTGASLDGG